MGERVEDHMTAAPVVIGVFTTVDALRALARLSARRRPSTRGRSGGAGGTWRAGGT